MAPDPVLDPALRGQLLQIRRASLMLTDAIERLLLVGKHEPRERSLAPLSEPEHDARRQG